MSQINIDEHFQKGTEIYELASQAVNQLDAARQSGLNAEADRLESNFLQSIINLRKSKGVDATGFNAVAKSIGGLAPQIESVRKSQNDYNKMASGISTTLGTAYALGVNVDPVVRDGITRALEMEDAARIKVFDSTIQALIKAKTEEKPQSQTKEEDAQLNQFEQQRVYGLAAMDVKSKGKFKNTEEFNNAVVSKLSDPNEYAKLTRDVKKREMVETQARKIYRRLEAARELYSNAELMNEFGDTMPTQWTQTLFKTSDNALHKALLGQLKGGDLAQGMAEVKAATGTAAGMAVEETKALASSISALDQDLSPDDAKKKVLQVINDAKFALERLGVDPELIRAKDKTKDLTGKSPGERILANEEKFLLPDERKFYKNIESDPSAAAREATYLDIERMKGMNTLFKQNSTPSK